MAAEYPERKATVSDQPKITWRDLGPDVIRLLKREISVEDVRDRVLVKAKENEENSKRVQAYIESVRAAVDPSYLYALNKELEDPESYGRDGVKRNIGF